MKNIFFILQLNIYDFVLMVKRICICLFLAKRDSMHIIFFIPYSIYFMKLFKFLIFCK